MIVDSLSTRCAAVYYCARADLAQDIPLSRTDIARRAGQYPMRVRQHLTLLGDLGLIPTEAPPPLLIDEVKAEVERLLLAQSYPTVRALKRTLPHRSKVALGKALALLRDNGVHLPDRQHKQYVPLTPPAPEPPVRAPRRRHGPCHLEIIEYRHAWRRIQTTITPQEIMHP